MRVQKSMLKDKYSNIHHIGLNPSYKLDDVHLSGPLVIGPYSLNVVVERVL